MEKTQFQPANTHESAVLDELLSLITPEEQERTTNRMMMAVKIADAMTAKGLSKVKFAQLMGQKPSVITKWLNGGNNFTVDTLTDIQRALGIKLLNLEEKTPRSETYHLEINLKIAVGTPKQPQWDSPAPSRIPNHDRPVPVAHFSRTQGFA